MQVRHVEPGDRSAWIALRLTLWPDENEGSHRSAVERFWGEPRTLGTMPEAVLVAVAPDSHPAVIGFAEVSRRAWARGLGCREFASDAVADNAVGAAGHRALGFEEVVVIRCFRKSL